MTRPSLVIVNCDKAVISHSGFGGLGVSNRMQPDKDLHVLGFKWNQFHKNHIWKKELQKFITKRHNTSVGLNAILTKKKN